MADSDAFIIASCCWLTLLFPFLALPFGQKGHCKKSTAAGCEEVFPAVEFNNLLIMEAETSKGFTVQNLVGQGYSPLRGGLPHA